MNIAIDICHPAHVHFFKNIIHILKKRGHKVIVIARDKDVSFQLLRKYKIQFIEISKHKNKITKKYISGLLNILRFIKICRVYKINMVIDSGAAVYPNVASYILGIPNISINNTEVFGLLRFVLFFSSVFITPKKYLKDFGYKHIRVDSFNELAFLHPKYFIPTENIKKVLNIRKDEKYALLRFVSWNAAEEMDSSGISIEKIKLIVSELEKHLKVFVSCEFELPSDLEKYHIEKNKNIKIGEMQNIEANASLFFGESGAMAAESAMLGVPTFFISSKRLGFIEELSYVYGLIKIFQDPTDALKEALCLLNTEDLKLWQKKKEQMLSEKIDITEFVVWFVENYPQSFKIIRENPEYQKRFI